MKKLQQIKSPFDDLETFILTKSDISSHIHIMYIQSAKESIEYKVVTCKAMTTEPNKLTDKKMDEILRLTLPIYFIIYFGLAFVLKSIIVAKRIGKNPLVLPKDDSAFVLIGLYFKLILIAMFIYVLVFAFFPTWYDKFLPIITLDNLTIKYIGLGILAVALIWTIIAQGHMKNSWRIGIDTETKTELITTGLFGLSRNPIFFGMILSLIGLFLTTPNALTGLFLILGYILIQIQIRLEEEFLTKEHGQNYETYKLKVRRLI